MIPNFYSGGPIRAKDLNILAEEIRKNEITQVIGGTFSRNTGGTTINVTQQNGGGGSGGAGGVIDGDLIIKGSLTVEVDANVYNLFNQTQPYGPFQILPGWSQSEYNVRVNGDSYLTNIETGENIPIQGLGAAAGSLGDVEESLGQFPLPNIGEYIWLEVQCTRNEIVSAYINFGNKSDWPDFPAPVQFKNNGSLFREAEFTRIAIAQVHSKAERNISGLEFNLDLLGRPAGLPKPPENPANVRVVRQITTTHLGVQFAVIQSAVVPILVPYSAAAKIPMLN